VTGDMRSPELAAQEAESEPGTNVSPDVSVIIPSWNMAGYLTGCLEAVTSQDWPPERYEVIVVDDGSEDGTKEVVLAIAARVDPHIRYAPQPHAGLSAARNTGIANARGDIVCFVDSDELVRPTHVRRTWELLMENPDVAGVGGPYRDYGDNRHRTCRRCSLTAQGARYERSITPGLLGGNMAIRRETFSDVGPFDEDLSGRGDEGEWFRRGGGLRFLFDPEHWLWHRRDKSTLVALCRKAFSDGRARPVHARKIGKPYRPRPWRIGRSIAHAVSRRCARGWILASRQAGADYQYLRDRLSRSHSAVETT
jgi:glycosyltransferase involved in cell wall biosynthesis